VLPSLVSVNYQVNVRTSQQIERYGGAIAAITMQKNVWTSQ